MNVKGIVVRITPYREHGAMVNLLCADQLLSFYARNIYKISDKNILLTSPLMYGEFTFSDSKKDLLTFKEMIPILDTRNYMNDFNKLSALNFLNEVTLRLFNDDDMIEIYPFLIKTLELLKENKNILSLLLAYLAASLKITGFSLNVDSCVITGSKENIVGVSYLDGGLVSKSAYRASKHKLYSPDKIMMLRKAFKVKVEQLEKLNFSSRDALAVLNDLLIFTYDQTGIRFKSEKLIQKIV